MKRSFVRTSLLLTIALLIIGAPSENAFAQRLFEGFGSHHSKALSREQLQYMGSSHYKFYVFFSRYDYAFGNIRVSYLGAGFTTFYLGSSTARKKEKEEVNKKLTTS